MFERSAMFKRVAVAMMALALSFGFSPAVSTVSAAGCADAKLTVWEDDFFGGDGIVICRGTNIANLGTIASNGPCHGNPWGASDWNDCISSGKYGESINAQGASVCLYYAANYSDLAIRLTTNNQQFSARWIGDFDRNWNDQISSVRWGC